MTADSKYPDFIGLDVKPPAPAAALFHIIPVPYEKTVSYGTGTALGPAAILAASQHLELYDGIDLPYKAGIYTQPPLDCRGEPAEVLAAIAGRVTAVLELGKKPVVLGGEHTVTLGALQALHRQDPDFGLVQFDAHADLRDTYEGSKFSHACVMRRALELDIPLFQIGVRSLSYEEELFRQDQKIGHLDARQAAEHGWPAAILPADFPRNIYITFDVDALDPALLPATGTPEPGGLGWYDTLRCLENIGAGRQVVGFDMVELAPIKGLHAPQFTVARLIYNLFGIIARAASGKR